MSCASTFRVIKHALSRCVCVVISAGKVVVHNPAATAATNDTRTLLAFAEARIESCNDIGAPLVPYARKAY